MRFTGAHGTPTKVLRPRSASGWSRSVCDARLDPVTVGDAARIRAPFGVLRRVNSSGGTNFAHWPSEPTAMATSPSAAWKAR